MATHPLPYNNRILNINIPDKNLGCYVGLDLTLPHKNTSEALESAVQNADCGPLRQLVAGKRALLILEDSTREVPLPELLNAVITQLGTAAACSAVLATGTHDVNTESNRQIVSKLGECARKHGIRLNDVIIHDCRSGDLYGAGKTAHLGNEILVNSVVREAEIFITFSDMKNHYFAGYSNAQKNFFPGICHYDSIERNHALALDEKSTYGSHPLHPQKDRRDNPLALDIHEGYHLISQGRPVYVLATSTNQNKILWCAAGLLEKVVPQGILKVDAIMGTVMPPAPKLIVSCGGYPNDETLYTAQRALELSKSAATKGGEILFIAGCQAGIGPEKSVENFYTPLRQSISSILSRQSGSYLMYSHKTFKFAQLISKMNKIWILSELPDETVRAIHLHPAESAGVVINRWLKDDPQTKINIIPQGNKIAVYAGSG